MNQAQEKMTQLLCLQKQQDLIKSCWEEMIWCEFQNIEKLETDEAHKTSEAAVVPFLKKFLLNVLSDQVKVPVDFDL